MKEATVVENKKIRSKWKKNKNNQILIFILKSLKDRKNYREVKIAFKAIQMRKIHQTIKIIDLKRSHFKISLMKEALKGPCMNDKYKLNIKMFLLRIS
jgi:hypothetical protein